MLLGPYNHAIPKTNKKINKANTNKHKTQIYKDNLFKHMHSRDEIRISFIFPRESNLETL